MLFLIIKLADSISTLNGCSSHILSDSKKIIHHFEGLLMENVKIKITNFSNLLDSFCQHRSHYSREKACVEALNDNNACGMFHMVWQV